MNGEEHAITAVKKYKSELNGTDDLELQIYPQRNRSVDFNNISELWSVEFDNIDYKIVYIDKVGKGNAFHLKVRCLPLFYWEFDKSIIHENLDGHYTANDAFTAVFGGSGYNFVLVDFSPAVRLEGFGAGETRLEMFKQLIERYHYEFYIDGKTVYMHHQIGNDTNFEYRYRMNASNISKSTDATGYFTYIRGFGDFEQGEEDVLNNAQLQMEYEHPMAAVVGKWEGKPVKQGAVSTESRMQELMEEAVNNSLQITVEANLHDIRKMGYDIAVPVKGDRTFLVDERINLNQEIRVYSVVTTYDERDRITKCDVTFGSQSIKERYKASINSLSKNFADLLSGKLKLPIISLEQIGMDMIKNIHDASSEIVFGDFGMMAISKTNPNHVFGVNSEGWYISQDGGATPKTIATAEGIYADALFAGTLWLTNDMNIESIDGYLNVTGSHFKMTSKNDSDKYFEITPDGAMAHHGFLGITRPDAYTDSNGKDYGVYMNDGVSNADMDVQRDMHLTPEATDRTETRYVLHGQGIAQASTPYSVERFYTSHKSKFITAGIGLALEGSSSSYITVDIIEIGGSVVASTTRFVRSSESTAWYDLTFEVGVPDFSGRIAYYIRMSSSIMGSATRALLTVNRVWLWG